MPLQGYTAIPPAATAAGSPITTGLADALRTNDVLFEKVAQSLLASPFVPNGTDGEPADADLDAKRFINATKIVLGTPKALDAGVPLIWFAREKIVINAKIDASGKGAAAGQTGDFGGSGGGVGGGACLMPGTGDILVQNGAAAESIAAEHAWKISRALMYLPQMKGGAGGPAGNGGNGGGVVCLCAPIIEIKPGAEIDASGTNGAGGGGGGGLVILIAGQLINVNDSGGSINVKVNGGGSGATIGGAGRVMKLQFH